MNNKFYTLALNRIVGLGPRTAMQIQQRWPDLAELFSSTKTELLQAGLKASLAEAIHDYDLTQVEEDLKWEQVDDHHLLTAEHPAYPRLLQEIYDPPLVLYAIGDLSALQQPGLAMVGSRNPSVNGSETAFKFAYRLAQSKLTIVSGLALGVDAAAHNGCLHAKGRTIAVLGSGLDIIYPYRHRGLASKIRANGLLLSEFPLKTSPKAGHFPRRNRIISGLSIATLVVEAAIKSGSLITARFALEQNRDVLAIPGSILNPQAKGCHRLLQQGAKLVETTQDVLDELNLFSCSVACEEDAQPIAKAHENLVKCIGFEVTSVDQIVLRSGQPVEFVLGNLAQLELQGTVKAVAGGYMRCK